MAGRFLLLLFRIGVRFYCHSCPLLCAIPAKTSWTPAFAGVTEEGGVIPAKAGIQELRREKTLWTPAFVGVTGRSRGDRNAEMTRKKGVRRK